MQVVQMASQWKLKVQVYQTLEAPHLAYPHPVSRQVMSAPTLPPPALAPNRRLRCNRGRQKEFVDTEKSMGRTSPAEISSLVGYAGGVKVGTSVSGDCSGGNGVERCTGNLG